MTTHPFSSSVPRDLAPRDISGTSDPFARVFWGNHSLETSVSEPGGSGTPLSGWSQSPSRPSHSRPFLPLDHQEDPLSTLG